MSIATVTTYTCELCGISEVDPAKQKNWLQGEDWWKPKKCLCDNCVASIVSKVMLTPGSCIGVIPLAEHLFRTTGRKS